MKNLIYKRDAKFFSIIVDGKEAYYTDEKVLNDKNFNGKIRWIPAEPGIRKKIMLSRNKYPIWIAELFELTNYEKEQYEKAKSEKEVISIVMDDCKRMGCELING